MNKKPIKKQDSKKHMKYLNNALTFEIHYIIAQKQRNTLNI